MAFRGDKKLIKFEDNTSIKVHSKLKTHIANSENIEICPGKQIIKSPRNISVRRPAFGEVGNQIKINPTQGAVKKLNTSTVPPPTKKIIKNDDACRRNAILPIERQITKGRPVVTGGLYKTHIVKRQESVFMKNRIVSSNPEPGYSINLPIGVVDVDSKEKDPMLVAEYIKDIMTYLLHLETKYSIKENYLESHKSTPRIRTILINWLAEVSINFSFVSETFHLSVAIVDRYLQANPNVGRETLQLVGTTALLIAAKYEELFIPDMQDYIYICDDEFTRKQMLRMEGDILKTLEFSFGRPLSLHFLRRYNKIAMVKPQHHNLGKYILELALQEYELCHIKPSLQAAAACFLSISVLNETADSSSVWTKTLVHYSTYAYADIRKVVIEFAGALVKAETSQYQTIRKKYSTAVYSKISLSPNLKGRLILRLSSQSKILKK